MWTQTYEITVSVSGGWEVSRLPFQGPSVSCYKFWKTQAKTVSHAS